MIVAGFLAVTRGYGEDREIFEHFPADFRWVWARLTLGELARSALHRVLVLERIVMRQPPARRRRQARPSGGAAMGHLAPEVSSAPPVHWERGERFPPLILAGPRPRRACLPGKGTSD